MRSRLLRLQWREFYRPGARWRKADRSHHCRGKPRPTVGRMEWCIMGITVGVVHKANRRHAIGATRALDRARARNTIEPLAPRLLAGPRPSARPCELRDRAGTCL